ncbi:PITH domain family protein [Leishmania donovani]|uniref:PITH domain family protein n=1 Tax=Leishmania donovani TaxID=5661 RepID=A0A504X5B5_LEIDO|nr:PITH domain family protein [Leishmania donovani]
MDVPSEDYDVSIMIQAIHEVQDVLTSRQFATFSEVDTEIGKTLKRYEAFGDGFERFHVNLTKDALHQKDQINDILPFIRNTSSILVHGSGNLLALTIACSIQEHEGVRFYICEGRPARKGYPHGSGEQLLEKVLATPEGMRLKDKLHNYCRIVPDSGVSSVMNNVDFVIMGAYCVTEHGGLVHSTGSLQIAIVAAFRNVPCYVLCETFKFAHIFPLSTDDLKQPEDGAGEVVPLVEFVPPSMITLIFSEQGIMPPSAVADEIHVGDQLASEGVFGLGVPINDAVDLSAIQLWNSRNTPAEAGRLFDVSKSANQDPISSDDDQELLISAPLSSVCRIKGVSFVAPANETAPSRVKIFVNLVNVAGFSSVQRLVPQEQLQLAGGGSEERIVYRVSAANFNGAETKVLRIELFGENTGKTTQQQVATNIVYEGRGNPADHQSSEEKKLLFEVR